jgi:hypothetical protein
VDGARRLGHDMTVWAAASLVGVFDLEAVSSSRPALMMGQRAQTGSRVAVAPARPRGWRHEGHPLTRSSTLPGSRRSGLRAARRGRRSSPPVRAEEYAHAGVWILVEVDAGLDEVRT